MRLRDTITRELGFGRGRRVRVGVGGGIGCPEAALAAFSMGAAFVVTGTINQMCREAGTCDYVRKVLSEATYSDVTMAPAADMFDQGVELQVIKKGTLFASRAKKLFQLFQSYDSLDEVPRSEMKKIEKRIFQKSCDDVWEETRNFYINRLKDPEKVERAETKDPKLKMSMTFRWYLSKSSGWANRGGPDRQGKNRQLDYQIWCGPAIGSFNEFIRGTYLDPKVANAYPEVVQCNKQVLLGACYLRRLQSLTRASNVVTDLLDLPNYVPGGPL
jgi:PfaD family protein